MANAEKRAAYAKKEHRINSEVYQKRDRARRQKLRMAALLAYSSGTPKCVCCGVTYIQFLNIDHINGGGNEHRKSIGVRSGSGFFKWLKETGYPEGFQILCCNCNHAKHVLGKCGCQDTTE
jgi:hypothetical protein